MLIEPCPRRGKGILIITLLIIELKHQEWCLSLQTLLWYKQRSNHRRSWWKETKLDFSPVYLPMSGRWLELVSCLLQNILTSLLHLLLNALLVPACIWKIIYCFNFRGMWLLWFTSDNILWLLLASTLDTSWCSLWHLYFHICWWNMFCWRFLREFSVPSPSSHFLLMFYIPNEIWYPRTSSCLC